MIQRDKEFDMPVLDNRKMSVERWKEACKAACSDRNYRSHYGFTETRDDYFVDGVQWADEHPEIKEKPANNANKVEPKFKVKYAGSEYNVLEIKESAGVTFYGIEDEPNHIDYVLSDDCEIISGYGVKEKGNSYQTKSATFSEQTSAWNEEDEKNLKRAIWYVEHSAINVVKDTMLSEWLKSLKERCTWKPSNIQMECLHDAVEHYHTLKKQ